MGFTKNLSMFDTAHVLATFTNYIAGGLTVTWLPQEIEILKSLSFDRSIVQFYGTCPRQGKTMLVLEHMEVSFVFKAKSVRFAPDFSALLSNMLTAADHLGHTHCMHGCLPPPPLPPPSPGAPLMLA